MSDTSMPLDEFDEDELDEDELDEVELSEEGLNEGITGEWSAANFDFGVWSDSIPLSLTMAICNAAICWTIPSFVAVLADVSIKPCNVSIVFCIDSMFVILKKIHDKKNRDNDKLMNTSDTKESTHVYWLVTLINGKIRRENEVWNIFRWGNKKK
jgi:hypothetical protein